MEGGGGPLEPWPGAGLSRSARWGRMLTLHLPWGPEPACIYLHGQLCDGIVWDRCILRLGEDCRVNARAVQAAWLVVVIVRAGLGFGGVG